MPGLSGAVKARTSLLIGIGTGGAVGSCLRYAASLLIVEGSFPFSTITVNLIGCFLLTYLFKALLVNGHLSDLLKKSITIGILGSFTTFSAFSLEIYLLAATDIWRSSLYLGLSIVGGLAACWLGYRLAPKKGVVK